MTEGRKILVMSLGLIMPLQAVTYIESVDGEFSEDRLSPTPIILTTGSNSISGRMGVVLGTLDLDYFSITIPEGQQLESIFLLGYINQADDGGVSFWALDEGSTFGVSPENAATEISEILGWSHLTNAAPTENLLSNFSESALSAGTYSFWLQETGNGLVNYGFEFNLTPVPEPGSGFLAICGACLAFKRKRFSPSKKQ